MRWTRYVVFALLAACSGGSCGDGCTPPDPDPIDPNPYGDPPRECADDQCQDGITCNGAETCELSTDSCAPGTRRCAAQACDPASGNCFDCMLNADVDMDGVIDVACGGTDCNDWDAAIYPGGAEEACAAGNASRFADEDCDPASFGTLDADMDTFVYDECCNRAPDGTLACGNDCDDGDNTRHPGAPETCNRRDDDCDRIIDEGIAASQTFYADCDGDMFGRRDWLGVTLCLNPGMPPEKPLFCPDETTATWAVRADDCNDEDASVRVVVCDPGSVRDCPGENLCSGVAAEHRNPLNRYVQRCERATCNWEEPVPDVCAPESGFERFGVDRIAPGTSCAPDNPCGCDESDGGCVPASDATTIATLTIALPAGEYAVQADGDIAPGLRQGVSLRLNGGSLADAPDVAGFYNLGGTLALPPSLFQCNVFTITVVRTDPSVPMSIRQISILRTG
jgi:hypothetical protein